MIEIIRGKIIVNNKECTDPETIGKELLEYIPKTFIQELAFREEMKRLIALDKEITMLSDWVHQNYKEECVPPSKTVLPFRPTYFSTHLLAHLINEKNQANTK